MTTWDTQCCGLHSNDERQVLERQTSKIEGGKSLPRQSTSSHQQSPITNHHPSTMNDQSTMVNDQSSIINTQSPIMNDQSSIVNAHHSSLINQPPLTINQQPRILHPSMDLLEACDSAKKNSHHPTNREQNYKQNIGSTPSIEHCKWLTEHRHTSTYTIRLVCR